MSIEPQNPFSLKANIRHLFKPPAGQFRPVDGLRALSILLVLAVHSVWFLALFDHDVSESFYDFPFWSNWVFNGEMGVDVFFVISGFLISSILMKEHRASGDIRLVRFYKRRFMRLMPAYLLAMAVGVATLPNAQYIWSNLLYINNLLPANTHFMPWTWSLAIEEQFYFLYPVLLIWALGRRNPAFMIGLSTILYLGSLIIRYLTIKHHNLSMPICWYEHGCEGFFHVIDTIYVKPWTRYGSFLPGIFAAYLHIYHPESLSRFFRRYSRRVAWITLVAVITAITVLSVPVHDQHEEYSQTFSILYFTGYRNLFTAAIGFILLSALYCDYGVCRQIARFLSVPALYPIGQLAYSTYLFHPFAIAGVYGAIYQSEVELPLGTQIALAAGLGIPLSLLIAAIVYLFVERPFMNMRGRTRLQSRAPVDG